jgi:hypothetical protein
MKLIRSNTRQRSLCIDVDDSKILLGGDFVVQNLFILLLYCGKRRGIFPSDPRKKVCLGEKQHRVGDRINVWLILRIGASN